ncbi:MAG: ABC transporter ATP-binding protein [Oligosphaeraceae bacterium]|nr:ABC transporter ATP-binding protein [Oligosphaeraceae bacterium]
MPGSTDALYQLENLCKNFKLGGGEIKVLQNLSLTIPRGRWVSLVGRSGSGKTTLLHLLGGLDKPSSGGILFQGENLLRLSSRRLTAIRRHQIGFIFQSYHLFPELSAWENAVLPALYYGNNREHSCRRGQELLIKFGLGARLHHRPRELSGGEQQRVAIARALINDPEIILADEPTGNLDAAAAAEILAILQDLRRNREKTIIMVTHDLNLAARADLCLKLEAGQTKITS